MIDALFMHMFEGLTTRYAADLAAIAKQYPFEPIVAKPTRITFAEGIELLRANGCGPTPCPVVALLCSNPRLSHS